MEFTVEDRGGHIMVFGPLTSGEWPTAFLEKHKSKEVTNIRVENAKETIKRNLKAVNRPSRGEV